jgi:spermidine synthase
MSDSPDIVHEFDTAYGHYQVVDMVYDGRPARVLYSGDRLAAQSGIATDNNDDLLFDYNQRLFELATGVMPKRLLLIGGGMYTLPSSLLTELEDTHIDVVEIDDGLDAVAAHYFDLPSDPRLTIIHEDGLQYLARTSQRYDMIIIDAYTHASAEPTLGSIEALALIARCLTPGGVVAANVIAAYYGRRSQELMRLSAAYQSHFSDVALYPASHSLSLWLPQNLVLVAQQSEDRDLDGYLRYSRLAHSPQPFDLGRDLRAL